MKTKWGIPAAAILLAMTVSTAIAESRPVENERQKRFDRNDDGRLDQREQSRMEEFANAGRRAERLRTEADEHDQIARRLRAESEELTRNLQRQFQHPQPAPEDNSVGERPRQHQPDPRQHRQQIKARADQFRQQAQKARQQGRTDQADDFLAKSEELIRRLQDNRPQSRPEDTVHDLAARMQELDIAADRAAQAGNLARAMALRNQARQVELNLAAANQRLETERTRIRHRELIARSNQAQALGNRQEAAALRKEAAALKQRFAPPPLRPRPVIPPQMREFPIDTAPFGRQGNPDLQADTLRQLEMLRRQVLQLRQMFQEYFILAGEDPFF